MKALPIALALAALTLALNPQPLPPGRRAHTVDTTTVALNPQPLPPGRR